MKKYEKEGEEGKYANDQKQWFTLLLMIIQAVMIIFIQPEIGSVSLCNLMFICNFC